MTLFIKAKKLSKPTSSSSCVEKSNWPHLIHRLDPQWEPLSKNEENSEQWWTLPGVTGLSKWLQEHSDSFTFGSQKTSEQHLKAALLFQDDLL